MEVGKKRGRSEKNGTSGKGRVKGTANPTGYRLFLKEHLEKVRSNKMGKFRMGKETKGVAEEWKKLSDDKRKEYNDRASVLKPGNLEDVPKRRRTGGPPAFRSRCSPAKLAKLNDSLTEEQKEAVKSLGFGSLLIMESQNLQREFIMKLVPHFNPSTSRIEFGRWKSYEVTPVAVARALGLEHGTKPVPKDYDDTHVTQIKELFYETEEGMPKGVPYKKLEDVIKKQKGMAGEKFLQAYLLLALACFMCPTTKDVAGPKLFPAVLDVELTKCREYAWVEFIHNWLVKQLLEYKTRVGKQSESTNKECYGIGGCVHVLMLIYFHLEPLGVDVGDEAGPLIECWTASCIKDRIQKEENLDLFDPMSRKFPEPLLRHPASIRSYHVLKSNFLKQLAEIIETDDHLMKAVEGIQEVGKVDVPSTSTARTDIEEMDSPVWRCCAS